MDPIEVRDWTAGELRSLLAKVQLSRDTQQSFILLTNWEKELIIASLEIAGGLW